VIDVSTLDLLLLAVHWFGSIAGSGEPMAYLIEENLV
jgi:hypothetical protein